MGQLFLLFKESIFNVRSWDLVMNTFTNLINGKLLIFLEGGYKSPFRKPF